MKSYPSISRDIQYGIMFKIKCNLWIERLKKYCNNDEKLFAQFL
jgi:hypothetical protein